jgi:hypothetical protein
MLIIIFEYTCNMAIHIHSKYTFVDLNVLDYINCNTQNTSLYNYRVMTELVTFATNVT